MALNPTALFAADVVTESLANRFLVTIGHPVRDFAPGELAPAGLHWCVAPEIIPADELEPDGIPQTGILPTLDLPRRMWAGGSVRILAPLRIGDRVERHSVVGDISRKSGRSGPLAFVRIAHRFSVAGELRLDEEQLIVYRAAAAPEDREHPPSNPISTDPAGRVLRRVRTDPAMLFRFSALTFNAHRIHYDRPYTTAVEGHPDILVHGTLTAALLFDAAAPRLAPVGPRHITFRALRPVPCGTTLVLCETGSGRLEAHDGRAAAMTAETASAEAGHPAP